MHELSIAQAIVNAAERHAGGRRVVKVEVSVGHLRQVVPSSLQFAFGLLIEGTPLAGAELALNEVPATVRCKACEARSAIDGFPMLCGNCGSEQVEIVAGEELSIDALEVETTPEAETVSEERIGDGSHV